MNPVDQQQYQKITQDLYSKNADLVNANKVFELIQELYEIMITSYSIESVCQRFIDKITQKMGFTDGLVLSSSDGSEHLRIFGITQTLGNQTILEMSGVATMEVEFPLEQNANYLVEVFNSGKSKKTNSLADIWSPYVKASDLGSISVELKNQLVLVYPIIYGDKILGSFAVAFGSETKTLTEFEKKALDRIVIVFGIAIDRVRINLELQVTQKSELEKAQEVIKLKDEFVFIATHDLRTPVTAIKGFVDLSKDKIEVAQGDLKENFEAISESTERLEQLVDDLLEVARSESGTIKIEVAPVNFDEVAEASIKEIEYTASKRNIKVAYTPSANGLKVLANHEKLQEIMENLISNAVKYNKDGGSVTVLSRIENDNLIVEVTDTGFGIPNELHPKVFQKFFRARIEGTEGVTGTGLGLFVVRMLIEKMHGQIEFESQSGVGTTFRFCLPLAADTQTM